MQVRSSDLQSHAVEFKEFSQGYIIVAAAKISTEHNADYFKSIRMLQSHTYAPFESYRTILQLIDNDDKLKDYVKGRHFYLKKKGLMLNSSDPHILDPNYMLVEARASRLSHPDKTDPERTVDTFPGPGMQGIIVYSDDEVRRTRARYGIGAITSSAPATLLLGFTAQLPYERSKRSDAFQYTELKRA